VDPYGDVGAIVSGVGCGACLGCVVSVEAARADLASARRRRLVALGLLRALAAAVVLVALYYLLPLDHITSVPLALAGGLLILLVGCAWQLRAIVRAKDPGVRAIVALASTVPLFLLLFASAYFAMARASPASFSTHHLTRTDALYFTVTIFSTVGFGDITPASQSARLVVSAQMLLDLLVLGLGIRVFVGAVQRARQQTQPVTDPGIPPEQPRQHSDGTS
jgi:divalent metal cation (Fe/Co/Zn/Cd) transporter